LQPQFECHEFLSGLIAAGRGDESLQGAAAPSVNYVMQQLAASYKVLNIQPAQVRSALLAQGISADFLALGAQGNSGFFNFFKAWAGKQLGRPLGPWNISPRIADALMILKDGRKYSVSPWNGTVIPTCDSLGPGWYLFRGSSTGFIVGLIAKPGVPSHDTVWIIPQIRSIVFVDMGSNATEVTYSCSMLVSELAARISRVNAYLGCDERHTAMYDFHCDHFGHYVWNVLSAWGALFASPESHGLKTIACTHTDRFWGRISEVFNRDNQDLEEICVHRDCEIYDLTFERRWLLSSVCAYHLYSSTAEAVIRYSMDRCEVGFMQRLLALRNDHSPLVLLSLRFENRAWVDQIEGFAELAQRLREDFPRIGFVIHGLSRGVAMGSTTAWMSLDVELQAAVELESALGGPQDVLSAVGLSIHESVAISNLCDAFVAPTGSGMALYKWLTNKPGVAFSNRFCSDPTNPNRWAFTVFDQCRDAILPAKALPLEAITDVEPTRHGWAGRVNFTLDRSVLYGAVRDLLISLGFAAQNVSVAD
jgi:hypothetical protein